MKTTSIITAILIILISKISFSQANLQIIHNSADPSATLVDIYVNDVIFVDDLEFRTSTEFNEVPAGVNLKIDIAPSNSSSSTESIFQANEILDSGGKYIIIANGLLAGVEEEAFDLFIYDMAEEVAAVGMTKVLVFHGATDAPTVDVYESAIPAETIVDNLEYGAFSGYLDLATLDYRLQVRDETGAVIVASFEAPLQTLMLEETALTVVASGFLNPGMDEAAFGLFVALPSGGDLVELPESMTKAQIIHNSSDIDAEMVDIYLNDEILLDDFMFRTATPFVELKAAVNTKIDIAPYTSANVDESIYTLNAALDADNKYIIIANGLLSGTEEEAFDLFIYDMAKEEAAMDMTEVLVFHGATDAPTVDVFESAIPAETIVDNLEYGSFSDYLNLTTLDYRLQVRDETGAVIVASYEAPLQTLMLEETALTVVASGFLNPGMDQAAFGLFVALPSGGDLVELPESMTKAQIIHNSSDMDAEMVDIYLNDEILLNDFMFRTATPFVELKAAVNTKIDIAPYTSANVDESIYTLNAALDADNKYIIIANGLLSGSEEEAFDLFIYDMAKEEAAEGMTDVLVFHGATDAPTVDIYESSIPAETIVDNLEYGAFEGYLELSTLDYTLDVQDETGEVTVASYDAPLQSLMLEETALTILASGFLNPEMDEAAFGLFVALPAGGDLVELPLSGSTSLNEIENKNFNIYPNPTNEWANIQLDAQSKGMVKIYNMSGQNVYQRNFKQESYLQINLNHLNSGMYIVEVHTELETLNKKLQLSR